MTISQTPLPAPTIYFGYGSNLWQHQMAVRCPTSSYLGVARLAHHTWLINSRGTPTWCRAARRRAATRTPRLDRNEGVPVAYTKEMIACEFWPSTGGDRVDTGAPPFETREMLVYIDRNRTTPDKPREEYVYRMNQGIKDAVRMGVPEKYVANVMREYIPEGDNENDGKAGGIGEFAKTQAAQFKDESGVFE
ncbi:hypothetical protein EJ07DRAFT_164638 [Lizonia empirigonia]|nr:hypothetical protein EJ07DRAFT_164638 [Lizonia empirigonia]